MKTIIVLTDFSDHALYALKAAAGIARKARAGIRLVHVYNLPAVGVEHFHFYHNFFDEIKTKTQERLDELADKPFLKNIRVQKHLLTDKLIWEAVNSPQFRGAGLVVVGSHGTSGYSSAFIGSNTEKVIRHANIPVLTIKNENFNLNIKKLVFASDFGEGSVEAFKKIREFPGLFKASLHLLKVITPTDFEPTPESLELMTGFIKKLKLRNCFVHIYNSYDVETGIMDFSEKIGAGMVMIPTRGRTGLVRLINGSVAERVARYEPGPVLSIRLPEIAPPVPYVRPGGRDLEIMAHI